jgi:hypothetical protein
MRTPFRILAFALLFISIENVEARSDQFVALDTYTCSEFLVDAKEPADGAKLLRSLMMISWSAGYAAAFQQGTPRADPSAVQLIAAALGNACRDNPSQTAVEAIANAVKQLAAATPVH